MDILLAGSFDAEIKGFYDKNKENFNLPESYHIAHILVTPVADPELHNGKNDDAKSPDQAKAKAARLLKEVQSGRDFGTVAKESYRRSELRTGRRRFELPTDSGYREY